MALESASVQEKVRVLAPGLPGVSGLTLPTENHRKLGSCSGSLCRISRCTDFHAPREPWTPWRPRQRCGAGLECRRECRSHSPPHQGLDSRRPPRSEAPAPQAGPRSGCPSPHAVSRPGVKFRNAPRLLRAFVSLSAKWDAEAWIGHHRGEGWRCPCALSPPRARRVDACEEGHERRQTGAADLVAPRLASGRSRPVCRCVTVVCPRQRFRGDSDPACGERGRVRVSARLVRAARVVVNLEVYLKHKERVVSCKLSDRFSLDLTSSCSRQVRFAAWRLFSSERPLHATFL